MYDSKYKVYDPTNKAEIRRLSASELLNENVQISVKRVSVIREPTAYKRMFTGQLRNCSVLCYHITGLREYYVHKTRAHFSLTPGDMMYVPQYGEYQFEITHGGWDEDNDAGFAIDFLMFGADGAPVSLGETPFIAGHDTANGRLYRKFKAALDGFMRTRNNVMLVKYKTLELLNEVTVGLLSRELAETDYSAILPAIRQIEDHPYDKITVGELARLCCVSETGLRTMFAKYTGGLSPIDYKNRLRLDKAEEMLKSEGVTVEYVARCTGFYDASYFHRMFKKYKGYTPRVRERNGCED